SHPRVVGSTWLRTKEGYVELNTSGVVLSSRACASIRGTIRYANGVRQYGFSMTIGEGTIFQNLLLIRFWEVHVRHIPRVQNIVVDHLTKIVDPELLCFHLLEETLVSVKELLMVNSNLSTLN
ncbi:hypothetical protein Golax_000763, partial [Gossypium laxum]|nr:hypothetical protein [Gossypium laxum]